MPSSAEPRVVASSGAGSYGYQSAMGIVPSSKAESTRTQPRRSESSPAAMGRYGLFTL